MSAPRSTSSGKYYLLSLLFLSLGIQSFCTTEVKGDNAMTNKVVSNFKVVNGVMTKYLTIGGGIDTNPSQVYVIIPGNPGMVHFYETFMVKLYSKLGSSVPIWCVGHAGHDVYDDPPLAGNEDLFSLNGQIKHKVEFLKDTLRDGAEVTLIGHSIGCHIILEAMKICDEQTNLKTGGYMLFPMMERMYALSAGKRVWVLAYYFRWLACFTAWFLNILPTSIKEGAIRLAQSCEDEPSFNAIMEFGHPARVKNVLHLARHEVLEVSHNLDAAAVEKFKDRLWFFYGPTDQWAPPSFYENLIEKVPGVRAEMGAADNPIPHAFVLTKNDEVADIVAKWHLTRRVG